MSKFLGYCYIIPMTDEGSTPISPEPIAVAPTPTPEPVPPETSSVVAEAPVVLQSDAVTEVVQTPVPEPVPQPQAAAPVNVPPPAKVSAGAHMRAVVKNKKQERLEKIMALAAEKRVIANDDVQKLLNVSDATVTRYLSELVKNGRLKRFGPKFHERYEPLGGSISAI